MVGISIKMNNKMRCKLIELHVYDDWFNYTRKNLTEAKFNGCEHSLEYITHKIQTAIDSGDIKTFLLWSVNWCEIPNDSELMRLYKSLVCKKSI